MRGPLNEPPSAAQRAAANQQANNNFAARSPDEIRALALDNLANLAVDLGVPALQFDANNTCVVSVEDKYTLLITFDPATDHLFLYSTLATFIPKNPEVKLRLYEFLLEGALLGRDMCGGGVGVSLKSDFILMSTSIYLPRSSTSALSSITPFFVEALIKWRAKVKDFLALDDSTVASGVVATPATGGVRGTGASNAASEASIPRDNDPPLIGLEVSEQNAGIVVMTSRGPAARAGLLAGDVIKLAAGRKVLSLRDFQDAVKSLRPGHTVAFAVDRAGSHLAFTVIVGSAKHKSTSLLASTSHSPAVGHAHRATDDPPSPRTYTYY